MVCVSVEYISGVKVDPCSVLSFSDKHFESNFYTNVAALHMRDGQKCYWF